MKKPEKSLRIADVVLFLSIIGLFLPTFLRSLHVVPRLWLRNLFYWSSGILAMRFTLLLILICIFQFKRKETNKFAILAITTVISPIVFCAGVFGAIMIIESFDATLYCGITGIWATILTILLVFIFTLLFKKKGVKRFVILAITVVFLPVAFGVGACSFFMFTSESTKEWIVEEGEQIWVYEKELLEYWGDPYDAKYEYINWFARGDKRLNFHELM